MYLLLRDDSQHLYSQMGIKTVWKQTRNTMDGRTTKHG